MLLWIFQGHQHGTGANTGEAEGRGMEQGYRCAVGSYWGQAVGQLYSEHVYTFYNQFFKSNTFFR